MDGDEGWLGFPDPWSDQKPWGNWYLTPVMNFGEIRRAQLAKSTLLTSTLVPLVCSDAKERVGCGKKWDGTTLIQFLVKLKPYFLSLRWKACLRQNCNLGSCACSEGPSLRQNTLMMMILMDMGTWILNIFFLGKFATNFSSFFLKGEIRSAVRKDKFEISVMILRSLNISFVFQNSGYLRWQWSGNFRKLSRKVKTKTY